MNHVPEAGFGHRVATPPQALHIERHELDVRNILDGSRIVQAEAVHVTRRRHHVLGEHHHGFAAQKCLVGFFHRRSRVRDIEVDGLHLRKQQAHVPLFERAARNHETHRARACHLDHCPVDIRNVVAHQKYRAFPGDILHARHEELVVHRKSRTQQLAQKRLRHSPERPHRPDKAKDAKSEEQAHPVDIQTAHRNNREDFKNQDAEVLDEVAKRKHVTRRSRLRIVQKHRKHREHVDAAAESQQRERDSIVGSRYKRDKENQDGRTRGPHRDKPHLDKVLRHAHRENKTDEKPDERAEDGIVQKGILVKDGARTELFLNDEDHEEDHHPEHRKSDNGLPEGAVLPRLCHLAAGKGKIPIAVPRELERCVIGTDWRKP